MKKKFPVFLLALVMCVCVTAAVPLQSHAVSVKSSGGESMVSSEEETSNDYGNKPLYADQLSEGTYDITVESSSSMFRITACQLTVADQKMTAVMTLSGTGYDKLYMGTDSEAAKAEDSDCIPYEENSNGEYTYTVPVEALNKDTDCAAHSIKRDKWYPRTLIFQSSQIPSDAIISDTSSIGDTSVSGDSDPGSSGSKGADAYKKASSVDDSKINYDVIRLPDGDYKIPVTMKGGSGRASITSPADVTMKNGEGTATIVWSSPNYDYMVVDNLLYEPVNDDGNSTFEIPVTKFDGNMKVIADTTAMSQPYEIEYTLNFDSGKAERQGMSTMTKGILLIIIIVAVVILGYVRGRTRRGKRAYDDATAEEEENIASTGNPLSGNKKKDE